MKIVAKKDRKLLLINTGNTQNENKAETIELTVPEEYEDYNKKIVFVTDDGIVWDIIQDNTYKLTKAITKYKQVDFYIWLTKGDVDFRSKTMPLRFYHNVDASDEITDEEIHGVNTVVNLLEEEIEKVENLNIEATKIGNTTTVTITKKDGTTESVEINDGVDGQDGQDGQNGKDGQDGKDAKINGKNSIEIEAGNNITIDNTETGIRINSTNDGGTTDYTDLENKPKINNVELSGNKSLNDLGIQPKGNYIEDNNYVHTDNNFNNTYKNKLEGLENYDDTEIKADISDIQDEQTEQNTEIEKLQTENARLKATLPTTTGEGQEVTLNKTAELEFIKPPLPMGNSEQESTTGKNLFSGIFRQGTNNDLQATTRVYCDSNYQIEQGKTYTFSTNMNTSMYRFGLNMSATQFPSGSLIYDSGWKPQASFTFTANANGYFGVAISKIDNSAITPSDISNFTFQLEEGSTATEYEKYTGGQASPNPDYPQEITNVTGDVEVKVQNKNWFDSEWEQGYIDGSTGAEMTNNSIIRTKGYISVKPTQHYTITRNITTGYINVRGYNKNKQFVGAGGDVITLISGSSAGNPMDIGKNICIIAPKDNIYYLRFNDSSNDLNTQFMMVKGDTSSDYIPYQEQTLPLTLGNIELCKIGDYQDYFYKESNKWYLHKEISKRVFNGTEAWYSDGQENKKRKRLDNILDGVGVVSSNIAKILSNLYRAISADNTYTGNTGIALSITGNTILIYDSNYNTAESTASFKQMLSNNNLILYYALTTPTDTEITDTALISQLEAINNAISYEEQTNISSNTIALFNVEAYQSTKLVLEEMATAIVALGGV